MCTAISFKNNKHYFGRNLDLDYSYDEKITVCPRNFEFVFREVKPIKNHYALIGMAFVVDDYPLFYDAVNENGLGVAGLNFPNNAVYFEKVSGKNNIASFEFIPWILSQCKNIFEAKNLCKITNLTDENFSDTLPSSPLHWIISDKTGSIVVESTKDGMKIYDNPTGVLTNNPTFDMQLFNLNNFKHISSKDSINNFSSNLKFDSYSLGLGGWGLPGDLSSMSRFVRAVFYNLNSICDDDENSEINQFFHLLESVYQVKGGAFVSSSGKYEYTIYSSCVDTEQGIYYYKTYNNTAINAIKMRNENLNGTKLVSYSLITEQEINIQN